MSKKVRGSKNRIKARLKVAKVHAKISDSRNDFNNKITTKLISENQAIAVESLNVKGMQKNRNLAKSIAVQAGGISSENLSTRPNGMEESFWRLTVGFLLLKDAVVADISIMD